MVRRPVDSSMRSRQTGHVGSSTSDGVGGAIGLALREADDKAAEEFVAAVEDCGSVVVTLGVNGSLLMSGKDS